MFCGLNFCTHSIWQSACFFLYLSYQIKISTLNCCCFMLVTSSWIRLLVQICYSFGMTVVLHLEPCTRFITRSEFRHGVIHFVIHDYILSMCILSCPDFLWLIEVTTMFTFVLLIYNFYYEYFVFFFNIYANDHDIQNKMLLPSVCDLNCFGRYVAGKTVYMRRAVENILYQYLNIQFLSVQILKYLFYLIQCLN